MPLPAVFAALVALVGLATLAGFLWRWSQGRVVSVSEGTVVRASDLPGLRRLPRGVTLLQFSTDVCAPCRATHVVLGELASERSNVTHIDLDVTNRRDLAARFNVLQTPTTLIVDERGTVHARIGGAPRRETLTAELDRVLVA